MVQKSVSRSKKALVNTVFGFAEEIIGIICGLILPRAILGAFGSEYNGLTSSITQFISCISLLKAGIGGVTKAALYKPLAQNDSLKVSEILTQTERFMRRISMIFVGAAVVFAAVYPLLISKEFDWFFAFSLVLIISISTFAQYYFGLTYQLLLMADQNTWVCAAVNSATYILNTGLSVLLIWVGCGIHVVKLGSAAVFVLGPLFYYLYVRKKYGIKKVPSAGSDLIKQRWDAVGHAVAEFINNNTDMMVITAFRNLTEVSVYTVYHLVMQGIKKITNVFITGFGAAFGNMYARGENDLMKTNLGIYEIIVFSASTVLYSTTLAMVLPFVTIYTKSLEDAALYTNNWCVWFAVIISFAGAFGCYRIPYQTIVAAVGHYKQTRNGAFMEAIINIGLSIILIIVFGFISDSTGTGLVGVAIGTLAAAIFRSIQYAIYLHKNIVKRSIVPFIIHVVLSVGIIFGTYFFALAIFPDEWSIFRWMLYAVIVTLFSGAATIATDFLFFKTDCINFIKKLKGIFMRKFNKKSV